MRRARVLLRLLVVASACALPPARAFAEDGGVAERASPGTTVAEPPIASSPAVPDVPAHEVAPDDAQAADEADVAPRRTAGGESSDPWDEHESGADDVARPDLRYFLEEVRIEGNARTHAPVIRAYVPVHHGDVIDANSEVIEGIAWALRSTGYFDRVRVRLERGSRRGWVVLVVDVRERNTIVVQRFQPGVSQSITRTTDLHRDLVPYVGVSIAETNLLGTGSSLEVTGLMSQANQGVRVAFTNPRVFGSRYAVRIAPFFNNAREFFGAAPVRVTGTCDPTVVPDCKDELDAKNAVVFYRRGGIAVGAGRAVGVFTHYSLDWQGEVVHVLSRPEAASHEVHGIVVPIDFGIDDGTTFNSVMRLSVVHDRRDDAALPTRGLLLRVEADVGTRLLGGRYDFVRFQALLRGYVPLAPKHTLRLSAFAGATVGHTPFFYQFHASDLSDLIPSRLLEMEIDQRPPLNVFNTSIGSTRIGDVATRFDVQYEYALYQSTSRRPVRRVHVYANLGVYTLSDLTTARLTRPTYDGFARVPIDLTFDAGFRIDTDIGLFDFGLSNLVGFTRW